jgi:cytochrome c biogenesis protein CcdA
MPHPKIIFRAAAIWNMLGAASALANPQLHIQLFYHWTQPLDFLALTMHYMLWTFIFLLGVGYGLIGNDPYHNSALLWVGILGKTGAALIWYAVYVLGHGTPMLLIGATGDLIWAGVFFWWLQKIRVKAQ